MAAPFVSIGAIFGLRSVKVKAMRNEASTEVVAV
jgi:hypothetical protein